MRLGGSGSSFLFSIFRHVRMTFDASLFLYVGTSRKGMTLLSGNGKSVLPVCDGRDDDLDQSVRGVVRRLIC